ncbi:O-antigen ligase family protein [Patescibacteria group bacterium]|nr:O-antigen ligase family protein [Patescibacteria group bacterium]
MRARVLTFGLPFFFFLLPWQTRWIFGQALINGEAFEFGVMSLYLTEILLLLVVLLSGKIKFHKQSILPARLALFILVPVAISVAFALNPQLSLVHFMHLALSMLLFLAMLDARVSIKRVMIGFTAGLILPALLGMWQVATGGSGASTLLGLAQREAARLGESVIELQDGRRVLRAYGGFSHPNVFGGYLAVGLAGIIGMWRGLTKRKDKVLLGTAAVFLTMGLILTFSRSAWLGLILGIALGALVLLIKNTDRVRQLVIPIAIIFIGAVFAVSVTGGLALSRFDLSSVFEIRSVSERLDQYKEFPTIVGSSWLFGHGAGNYSLAVAEAFPDRQWWEYQPIHNVPLLVLGEIGLVGLIIVLLWSSIIDKMNFARFPNPDAVTAFMMGNVILVILFFDHYLWSSWAGLALVAYVMALTVRLGIPYSHE